MQSSIKSNVSLYLASFGNALLLLCYVCLIAPHHSIGFKYLQHIMIPWLGKGTVVYVYISMNLKTFRIMSEL